MEIDKILQGHTLLVITRDDLIEFASKCVNHIQISQVRHPNENNEERPLSQPEAIKFLGKSRQTLIKWRKKGIIVGYRIGGRIYYKSSELISALEKLG